MKRDDDLDREIRAHLDEEARERRQDGMDEPQSIDAARRTFGNATLVKEEIRNMSRWTSLEQAWQDVRYGARLLVKNPAVSGIAILTLALGIGANTAIFSLVEGLMLKPFPYPEAERIVVPATIFQRLKTDRGSISWSDIGDWKKDSSVFEAVAAISTPDADVTGGEEPQRVRLLVADEDYFRVMGVRPMLGRAFTAEENAPKAGRVAVLTYDYWMRHYGGDEKAVGSIMEIASVPHTVIGIMPKDSTWPEKTDILRPIGTGGTPNADMLRRDNHAYQAVARLRRGLTLEQAQSRMTAMGARIARQYSIRAGTNWKIHSLRGYVLGDTIQDTLLVLLGAVLLVLLIACVNVANLLMARGATRGREVAIRNALGAGWMRLLRQFLAESLLLSAAGGAAGILVGYWGLKGLVHFAPADVPRLDEVAMNSVVLAFTFGLCVLTAIFSGLMPAIQAMRISPVEAFREAGRGFSGSLRAGRLRSAMVVAELALAIVLLAGAGLLVRSFAQMQGVDPGFPTRNLLTMRFALPYARYPKVNQVTAALQQILEGIRRIPGVRSASATSSLPLDGGGSYLGRVFLTEGQPEPPASKDTAAAWCNIQPRYFETMGIPLVQGRLFTEHDTKESTPVIVISQRMAGQMFPNGTALGRRIRSWRDENAYREIVGVVGDVRFGGLTEDIGNNVYVVQQQDTVGFHSVMLTVRTAGDPNALVKVVRGEIWSHDRKLGIADIKSMDQIVDEELARTRFSMFLLGIFAATALVLAAVGIYGVMSYTVAQRTREIGIRIALGAVRRDVLRMVAGRALVLATAGVACGIAGSVVLTRLMKALLYQVSPTDAPTLLAGSALLVLVALAAAYLPARRAMRVDPIVTLRYE
jgi:putative ABC transport system permease protein